MKRLRLVTITASVVLMLLLVACGNASGEAQLNEIPSNEVMSLQQELDTLQANIVSLQNENAILQTEMLALFTQGQTITSESVHWEYHTESVDRWVEGRARTSADVISRVDAHLNQMASDG
ncbi:MAG: hypothetical protein FWE34_06755 [Defluviitaleaceae bacterium]|nr:hypothetical protein [Defluviitaleaceae bacterium]